MTAWRWVGAAALILALLGAAAGAYYVADDLRSDPSPVVFEPGNGPSYFPQRPELSPAMTAPEYAPVFDGNAAVSDISAGYRWQPRGVGGGGWVKGLQVQPAGSIVIARTDVGGAFIFDRDAERWAQLITTDRVADPQRGDYAVESIGFSAADPDRVYLAVGRSQDGPRSQRGRVLTSRDGGATFAASAQEFEIHGQSDHRDGGERIAVSPTDPDQVWLGTTDGLWRSRDGAVTFEQVPSAPRGTSSLADARGVEWVLVDAEALTIGVAGAGVYRSVDDGATWAELWSATDRPFDAEADASGVVWAVDPEDDRLRRYDPATGEVSVVDRLTGDGLRGLAVHPDGDLVVVLTGGRHLWRTTDGGRDWDRVAVEFECPDIPWLESFEFNLSTASSPSFDPLEPDGMWVPQGFAVWWASDVTAGVVRLTCRTEGIEELVVNDIVVPESDVLVAASWDRPLFHLPPGGVATAQVGPTDRISSGWDVAVSPADPSFLVGIVGDIRFCCEEDGQAYVSVLSDDGGRTWEPLPSYGNGTHPEELRFGSVAINAADPANLVWLPSWDGAVHYSTDRGATWTRVILPGTEDLRNDQGRYVGGSHFQYYLQREVLLADPVLAGRFYLFHAERGVYRSDDGGETWTVVSANGLPTGWTVGYFNAQLSAVPGREGHLLYTPGRLIEGFFPLYESRDGGETWSIVPNTADVDVVGYGAPIGGSPQPTILLAGSIDGAEGLYRSTDLMATWELIGENPGGYYRGVTAITGDPEIPGRVYVGLPGTTIMQGDESS